MYCPVFWKNDKKIYKYLDFSMFTSRLALLPEYKRNLVPLYEIQVFAQ
jgi:hypothetical protein